MSGPQFISRTQAFADVAVVISIMPKAFDEEILVALRAFAPALQAKMVAGVPVRQGPRPAGFRSGGARRPPAGAASLLSTQIDADDLRLSGGLLTPEAKSLGFTAYILDHGRGMKNTRSRPRSRLVSGSAPLRRYSVVYTRAISPISPDRYSITFGAVRYWARDAMDPMLAQIYDRWLMRIAWNTVIDA